MMRISPPERPEARSNNATAARAARWRVAQAAAATLMWGGVVAPACVVSCGSSAAPDAPSFPDAGSVELSGEPVLDASRLVVSPPLDGAAACPPGICNYQTGVGCAADTPSCVPLPQAQGGAVSPACSPAGTLAPGEPCREWSDCGAGSVCAAGWCRKLCCAGDYSACPGGEHCVRSFKLDLGAGGVVASGADLCFPVNTCKPLSDTCAANEARTACQIADGTGATACLPAGTRGAGDRCSEEAPCLGGFTCVDQWCRRFCAAVVGGGEPRCPGEEGHCVHFQNDPPGVGECTPI